MKPTTPLELELIFLRDLDRRLSGIEKDMKEGHPVKSWAVGGIRNALNDQIADVVQQRDEEIANNKGDNNAYKKN